MIVKTNGNESIINIIYIFKDHITEKHMSLLFYNIKMLNKITF